MSSKNQDKSAFVLSGGGARAAAHLGMLKAFEEEGVRPGAISGSSTGALVACLYASGFTPDEILEIFKNERLIQLLCPKPDVSGVLDSRPYLQKLVPYFKDTSFNGLNLPVFICVLNMNSGKAEYFHEGDFLQPLQAALSIPGLFKPVMLNNYLYLDGGSVDNLPVEPICDYSRIYGFHVNPLVEKESVKTGVFEIILRALDIVLFENLKNNISKCTYFVEPQRLSEYRITDFANIQEMYDIGYDHVKRWIKEK